MQTFCNLVGIVIFILFHIMFCLLIVGLIVSVIISFKGCRRVASDILQIFNPKGLLEYFKDKRNRRKRLFKVILQILTAISTAALCTMFGYGSIIQNIFEICIVILVFLGTYKFFAMPCQRFDHVIWTIVIIVPIATFVYFDYMMFIFADNTIINILIYNIFWWANILCIIRLGLLAIQLLGNELYSHKEGGVKMESSVETMVVVITYIIIQIATYASTMFVFISDNEERFYGFNTAETISGRIGNCFYYVIITFMSIGYGDITPATIDAKILTCCIALAGYLTSACVIGKIIGALLNDKKGFPASNNDRSS